MSGHESLEPDSSQKWRGGSHRKKKKRARPERTTGEHRSYGKGYTMHARRRIVTGKRSLAPRARAKDAAKRREKKKDYRLSESRLTPCGEQYIVVRSAVYRHAKKRLRMEDKILP
ncbi:hypothetical protein AMTR_s00054p00139320 [Amborella trichopoda]|uniref:Uncharacterized protein n=1 Tax=Amborella trichopoda TaxID=13333 RepID=U5D7F3_AMBTC|nr:hypothetical protein AMTR_s00054p00139320 [Amborella trichopoda]